MPRDPRLRPFKPIPFDVFERIMFFSLYSGNEFSSHMQDDDMIGCEDTFLPRQAWFIRTFPPLNKEINRATVRIFWHFIFLRTAGDLYAVLDALSEPPQSESAVDLGSLCWRIEARITGPYLPGDLGALIERTPNLKVFIIRNDWVGMTHPLRIRPVAILEALATHARGAKRLQFESPFERPSVSQVKLLLTSLHQLVTLHIDCLSLEPRANDVAPLGEPAPCLQTLSIGCSAQRYRPVDEFHRTADLLDSLSSTDLLPLLNTLYMHEASIQYPSFLNIFGPQIRDLGFALAARWVRNEPQGHLMTLCPELRWLTIWVGEDPGPPTPIELPFHPTLHGVWVVYFNRRTLRSPSFGTQVMNVLRSLDSYGGELGKIVVVARPFTSAFQNSPWFRYQRRSLAKDGVALRGPVFTP